MKTNAGAGPIWKQKALFLILFVSFLFPSVVRAQIEGERERSTLTDIQNKNKIPQDIQDKKERFRQQGLPENRLEPLPENKEEQEKQERPQKEKEIEEAVPEKQLLPSVKRRLSDFEAYVQGKQVQAVSTEIQQFGYDLFQVPSKTFAPTDILPVATDYLLGPGDEVRITVWGKVNADYTVKIDRDGQIRLPQIGVLPLSGLTFSESKAFLEKEFSHYYKASEVKMNVSMGRLRSIRIFVVGKVERPGSYAVSSFSTLIHALFVAGGPSKIGSMRDIQVKRNGETIVHFDLYDFLLQGDKTKDIRLMAEDVVFVPPVGPLIGMAGQVKSPAIYELKEETRLLDLVRMAGGLTPIAFEGRVQIRRIIDRQYTTLFEEDLVDLERSEEKNLVLVDGDLVKVFPVSERKSTAFVSGAVATPGAYGIVKGATRISDLISKAGGLDYFASDQAELTRLKVTQEGPKTERFVIDLSKALQEDPAHDFLMEVNDYLSIKTIPEWGLYKTVQVTGEVRFPGVYTVKKGETLPSLIKRAGGFTEKAYLRGAVFTRESVRELQQKQLENSIDRLEQQILSQSALMIGAALTPDVAQQQQAATEQRRSLIAKMRSAKANGRMTIRLDQLDKMKGTVSDIVLEDGDYLMIPQKPQEIHVMGAVYNQTAFLYDSDATVSAYLKRAGGMTQYAEKEELYVLKVDGAAISTREEGGFWGRRILSSELDPGDTIVVPEKIERIAWLREFKDVTQILYQIAVAAGVLILVF
ncbi:MAG: SLBB domain-containing protein [Candidatus Manganitrophaceae bacterium]